MNKSALMQRPLFEQICVKSIKWSFLLLIAGAQLSIVAHAQNTIGDPPPTTENGTSRYPYQILLRQDTHPNQADEGHNTEYDGPNTWGHLTTYDFTLLDNNGKPYGLGDIQEVFSNNRNSTFTFIGRTGTKPGAGDTWRNGIDFVSGNWTDGNGTVEHQADTGRGTFWYSFSQVFHSINSPAGEWDQKSPYQVQHVQAHATRS